MACFVLIVVVQDNPPPPHMELTCFPVSHVPRQVVSNLNGPFKCESALLHLLLFSERCIQRAKGSNRRKEPTSDTKPKRSRAGPRQRASRRAVLYLVQQTHLEPVSVECLRCSCIVRAPAATAETEKEPRRSIYYVLRVCTNHTILARAHNRKTEPGDTRRRR